MAGVTVASYNHSGAVIPLASGDILGLATTIANILTELNNGSTGPGSSTTDTLNCIVEGPVNVGASAPAVKSPVTPTDGLATTAAQLIEYEASGQVTTVPSISPSDGEYVYDTGSANTLTGSNIAIVTNGNGGEFNVTGNSTVAATGGTNTISAAGSYLISTGTSATSDNFVSVGGSGTVATGLGTNTITAGGGSNVIKVEGTNDLVHSHSGATTVESSGSKTVAFGGSGDLAGTLDVISTGDGSTIAGFASNATVNAFGNGAMIVDGSGTSDVNLSGTNDTVLGGTGAGTVNAGGNAVVYGGSGQLTFVGGAGTATILGGTGNSDVTAGSGGVVFAAASNATATVIGGSAVSTIFGAAGSVTNFDGSVAGVTFLSGAGNETLNAAGSSTANTLLGSGAPGSADSLVGGSGTNSLWAGAGSDTLGGSGSNSYAFFAANTAGGHDYITDFGSNDYLFLVGYASTGSAASLESTATGGGTGPVTLTLSDSTQITFTNLTSTSALEDHILYVGRTNPT